MEGGFLGAVIRKMIKILKTMLKLQKIKPSIIFLDISDVATFE